jgi:hypothetical protein
MGYDHESLRGVVLQGHRPDRGHVQDTGSPLFQQRDQVRSTAGTGDGDLPALQRQLVPRA